MIVKERGKWVVRSHAGAKLGTHKTRADALRQLAAVEASKRRKEKGSKRA